MDPLIKEKELLGDMIDNTKITKIALDYGNRNIKRSLIEGKKNEPTKEKNSFNLLFKRFFPSNNAESQPRKTLELEEEINMYLKEREVTYLNQTDILEWWKGRKNILPQLSIIARDILGSQASSVPCERLFSIAGNFYSKNRNRLKSKKFMQSFCLKNWLNIE